ncbi:MAG: hypothetical protein NVSMB25_02730 [Thermoleophilaceae bacterium]
MAPRPESRLGRPSTGAKERILAAGVELLEREGYAALTTAKVAARSGQNKALIAYHFGSKQGLVAAAARDVSTQITLELLEGIGEPRDGEALVRGLVDGVARIMNRDEGLARLYFDLASYSVVEPEVRAIMAEMKAGYRAALAELLRRVSGASREGVAVFLVACLEGLALEQLQRGESPALDEAREIFVRSATVRLVAP